MYHPISNALPQINTTAPPLPRKILGSRSSTVRRLQLDNGHQPSPRPFCSPPDFHHQFLVACGVSELPKGSRHPCVFSSPFLRKQLATSSLQGGLCIMSCIQSFLSPAHFDTVVSHCHSSRMESEFVLPSCHVRRVFCALRFCFATMKWFSIPEKIEAPSPSQTAQFVVVQFLSTIFQPPSADTLTSTWYAKILLSSSCNQPSFLAQYILGRRVRRRILALPIDAAVWCSTVGIAENSWTFRFHAYTSLIAHQKLGPKTCSQITTKGWLEPNQRLGQI